MPMKTRFVGREAIKKVRVRTVHTEDWSVFLGDSLNNASLTDHKEPEGIVEHCLIISICLDYAKRWSQNSAISCIEQT